MALTALFYEREPKPSVPIGEKPAPNQNVVAYSLGAGAFFIAVLAVALR